MLRAPGSKYVGKRDKSLQKVKTFYDAEAKVVGYEPGKVRCSHLALLLDCTLTSPTHRESTPRS